MEWIITINDSSITDEQMLAFLKERFSVFFKYVLFQREKDSANFSEHFHIFIHLSSPMTFKDVKRLFLGAYIEPCLNGTFSAMSYCTRLETRVSGPYELGELFGG